MSVRMLFIGILLLLLTSAGVSAQEQPVSSGATVPAGASASTPAALSGWPARAPMSDLTCPEVLVCYATGTLPPPLKLPSRPPAAPPAGVIAYTDDGMAHWTARTDPHADFGPIACPSATQCYALAAHIHLRTVDAHHQIVSMTAGMSVTVDGGRTWQELALPPGSEANAALACPAVTTCVLWGYVVPGAVPRSGVLRTTDGGRTWTRSRTVVPGRPNIARLACPTVRVCYLYGGFSGTSISVSRDGGVTWRTLPGTDMFKLSGVPSRALAAMGGIACPSARVCYTSQGDASCQCDAWGPYGTIFGTQDGGQHWSRLYLARGRDYPSGAIACPGVGVCYVVGSRHSDAAADGTILSTQDRGRTWTRHPLPVAAHLTCPSVTTCYAGVLYRTSDGGTTWQPLP